MKVLCLVDGAVRPPDRWLWNYLPAQAREDDVDFLSASPADYHELLAIPSSHISLVHLGGWEAGSGQPAPAASASFIFAGGRTERDYRTFFDAVAGLECPVIVNARPFNLRGLRRPLNVQVNDLMPLPDYWALLRQASLVVVPLKSTPYAAGLSHILQAMSIGRPIIASHTTSTVDYLEPEKPVCWSSQATRAACEPPSSG